MRKKLIGSLLCLVLLLALVGGAQGAAKYRIYLITMDQMDQHWVNVDAGARKAFTHHGHVRALHGHADAAEILHRIERDVRV